ncbi:hypothetical protein POKO110462_18035 [Pontibacter korlensis]|uniref:Outer membrane protein beta-barrel domain-containing protein n=1 Tax=Pontibacter korlensis TaxID=400092 RepID=A0A0E3UX56_9BACT|nr:hypothetical protein [Pontibacter korlensis]AKD03957.1 hypothetical protein PKOR_13685 [Pontibacter korlensis]
MKLKQLALLITALLLWAHTGNSQNRAWEVAVAGGGAHNFLTPLHISQSDAADIELRAKYCTEPFNPPVYYDIRVSTWQSEKGWELKFTHHKLILDNPPPEVQRFSITDGYNLLTLNRLWLVYGLTLSAGAGLVITHPESTIHNVPYPEDRGIFDEGYYISGSVVEAAVTKRYYFTKKWFILGEGRVTASYVEVPVANGEAQVPNVALHGLLGLGFKIR